MPKTLTSAGRRASGRRFAVVAAQFHEPLIRPLVDGAMTTLREAGVADRDLLLVWVPGSFELPTIAQRLAASRRYAAILCLGVVIRGDTPHFDYVAGEAARGIAEVGRITGVPTIFGVVTADHLAQAAERAGGRHGNRGADAARTALAMADVMAQISRRRVLPQRTPTAVLGQATGAPVPAGGRGGPPRRVTHHRDTPQVVG